MCSLFAQGPYVLQLMNLLVCIDPALEKKKENTAKKALQRKRKGFQTRTGMAMAAL